MADLLQGIQNRLVSILRAACVLPAGVDVITVRVDDVRVMARVLIVMFFRPQEGLKLLNLFGTKSKENVLLTFTNYYFHRHGQLPLSKQQ